MSAILRRSRTVCDVRPECDELASSSSKSVNGKRKKSILGKLFRSFSKLGKRKQFQSQQQLNEEQLVAQSESGIVGIAQASQCLENAGRNDQTPGSDSASTGYVSEGSSRRAGNCAAARLSVDLEKENKLARRAHARFRSDDSETSNGNNFLRNREHGRVRTRNMHVFTLRSSDTDLDRDETDLNTDEERDSSVYTESDSSSSDSFYSTDSSSDSEPSQRGRRGMARSVRPRRKNGQVEQKTSEQTPSETNWTPSAPSPALRARILQLELGDTIPTDAESVNSKEPVSPKLSEKITGSPKNGAVKNIAAKFTFEESQSNEDRLEFLGRSKSVAPILATPIMRKNRVLEKFAPNLDLEQSSQSSDKETPQLEKPQALRRTQSTKILDLAASLFQPGDEIQTGEKKSPIVEKKAASKSQVSRSQTMKLLSPPMQARRQSQDSFIRELLEMAKTDSGTSPLGQKSKEINDFKSQISMASTKIIRRKTMTSADVVETEKLSKPTSKTRAHSVGLNSSSNQKAFQPFNATAELDPFVEEILANKTVPETVKQKIREECWSLFNDPKTPKGVKQCILNTMMTKSQNE
ncbi:Oidioi.mRNA.OKI2018_I69.XSR.g14400.t1.cds [Oikopleura dioica]|uniref:Oidioi.mRNA.OKI2018_I69.XSR.g14400.t1.cds n=1 Tax=Oikopleura dioica TaxID=34765 RepID=A0ABN7SDM3_OIKDI|nr:Oidioi.mRNA.OKI2018_I69.XSR.g14400.t1.cds [Oikopleura dioica]